MKHSKPTCTGSIAAIDSHAHVFERGLPLAPVRRHAPEYDALVTEYLTLMDESGVSHGVLVQPSFLGTDNGYLLSALAAHPRRLRGVVMLDPETDADTLRRLDAAGVRGLRLNLVGLPIPDLHGPSWQAMFKRLRALDWHVEVHRESADLMRCIAPVMHAGCKVVVDHFGRPLRDAIADPEFAALLQTAGSGLVWVKLAASYRSWPTQEDAGATAAAQALVSHFGAGRLVWGSDWPNTQHRHLASFASALQVLSEWVPDAGERRRILVDTPAELFRFD